MSMYVQTIITAKCHRVFFQGEYVSMTESKWMVSGGVSGSKDLSMDNTLDFITSDTQNQAVDKSAEGKQLVATTAAVNIRTNSSMDARVIKVVPEGAKVTVIDYENGWYRVDYDYDAGYLNNIIFGGCRFND